MPPIATGYAGIGKEATFGTAVAPGTFLPIKSVEVTTDPQVYYPEEIRSNRAKSKGVAMGRKHEASLAMDAEPATLGHLLLGALGAVATSQPDAVNHPSVYNHVFSPANVLPSYTIEKYDSTMIQRVAGAKIDTLSLSIESAGDGVLNAEVGLKAKSVADQAAAASPNYSDKTPFVFHNATVTKGGATNDNVKNISLEISNKLKDDHFVITKSKDVKEINEGMREVSGSVEMYFRTKQDYLDFINGSQDSLTITFEGGLISGVYVEKLTVELPKIQYDGFEVPMGGADDEVMASLEFTALYDSTSAFDIKATLVNSVSAY
jgi:hypothetical protein